MACKREAVIGEERIGEDGGQAEPGAKAAVMRPITVEKQGGEAADSEKLKTSVTTAPWVTNRRSETAKGKDGGRIEVGSNWRRESRELDLAK
jgi:hypothetical protein